MSLKDLTCQYWDEHWDIEKYIEELLPKEMNYLKQENRLKTSKAEVLIQLVGFSWEPLLISLCAYEPQELILILNKLYNNQEGAARGEDFKKCIGKLKEQSLISAVPKILPNPFETVDDTPKSVFKFLKKHALPLINKGKKVVIDITGAKKSMVSGAYLFASYTNCTVSYLDFDKYNEEYGRPYGYTCKINELKNPMELFKLREWIRVEELYEKYAFGSAIELIYEIKKGTQLLIEGDEANAIELLVKCLEFYELWDMGDYRGAWELYNDLKNQINIPCPISVQELGEIWYSKNNLKDSLKSLEGLQDITQSIYSQINKVIIYARDEVEKIKRLIRCKEDYRSALLRAAGLSDFLLKARVIKLWLDDKFVIEMDNKSFTRKSIKEEWRAQIDKKLLEFAGASDMIKALRWESKPSKKGYVMNLYGLDKEVKAHCSENSPVLDKFWKHIKKSSLSLPDDIFYLRNKAIHFCLSVPKEVAEVSLEFAEENLNEFITNWGNNNLVDKIYEAMDLYEAMHWNDLCDACGIDFLPKLRRQENE